MRLICAAVLAAMTASPAIANDWSYKDWRVSVTPDEGTQGKYVYCRASTGGDGDPVLEVNAYSGAAGPPHTYPMAVVVERSPRGHPTAIQQGQPVHFIFDFDRRFAIPAKTSSWFDPDGIATASTRLEMQDQIPMLQAMKQGRQVEIWAGSTMLYEASLSGFTAAYGKMMDECGFSLDLPAR